ncbi:hypothetical protein JHK85_029678 [Glycine max]|nr:hypothetical protein JHK85_029678 [Glycine max]
MVSQRQRLARKRYKSEHPELFPKPEPTPPKDPDKKKKKNKNSAFKRKRPEPKPGSRKRHLLRVPGMKPGESCFICKAMDHIAKLCPEKAEWEKNKSAYVFFNVFSDDIKCAIIEAGGTKFAECFVCNQRGHLSKNCPQNTHGIYPKGGCCKICGGVTHLAKDCPDKGKSGSVAANRPADGWMRIDERPMGQVTKFVSGDDIEDDFMTDDIHSGDKKKLAKSTEDPVKPKKKKEGPKELGRIGGRGHCNMQSEFSDAKKHREEENPQTLASPEHGTEKKKKKKRKRKKITEESNEQPQVEVCPKPFADSLVSIVPQEENAETSTQNPNPPPRKKKKKNSVQGAEQVQTLDPSILLGVEPDVTKEEGAQQASDLPAETITQNRAPTPKKNKKDVQGAQQQLPICDPSNPTGVEPNFAKEEATQQGDANETAVPGINEERPGPDSMPLEDTPRKKKSAGKKKNVLIKPHGAKLELESKESNNTEHPQQCSSDSELKMKMKKGAEANAENSALCPKPELALPNDKSIPIDSVVNKRTVPTEAKVEDPQACSKPKLASSIDLPAPTNPEKKKEAEPIQNPEARVEPPQPQSCPASCAESPGNPAIPIDQSRRKQKSKRGKEKIIMCSEEKVENQGSSLHMDITLNQVPDQVQQGQTTPISLQPASLTDHTIPVHPATPIDPEQTMKKKKKKQRKNALEWEELNDNKNCTELPEISIQTSPCLIEASPIDPAIPMGSCLTIPICPAISADPEQEMSKKKKKRKSVLKSEAAEPNEHNKLPEAAPPDAPVQKSIYHIDAPSIDPIIPMGPSPPVDTETPIDQGQEMTKKKRKKKKRIVIITEGTETNEHGVKPSETPVERFTYPTVATSIDPKIPVLAPPIDTATPINQSQKTGKKKRKMSALISKGAEPNEHDDKPAGTPVQRSIHSIAEPSIDPTIPTSQAPPVDPATLVDPEPMTKKKRKKRNSALKNEGLESEKHNADPTAETPVQKTEGSTTENFKGRCNAGPAGKTPVQRTDSLRVTKSPFKHHGESSLRCRACRQPGHRFQQCQRLKCLSRDEEVCFFCGEIGHSLGKCNVSQAGGGRFAKCLLCYEHGHFSYNCPQNGHGIDPKAFSINRDNMPSFPQLRYERSPLSFRLGAWRVVDRPD